MIINLELSIWCMNRSNEYAIEKDHNVFTYCEEKNSKTKKWRKFMRIITGGYHSELDLIFLSL